MLLECLAVVLVFVLTCGAVLIFMKAPRQVPRRAQPLPPPKVKSIEVVKGLTRAPSVKAVSSSVEVHSKRETKMFLSSLKSGLATIALISLYVAVDAQTGAVDLPTGDVWITPQS
jgi:hypothetical protein